MDVEAATSESSLGQPVAVCSWVVIKSLRPGPDVSDGCEANFRRSQLVHVQVQFTIIGRSFGPCIEYVLYYCLLVSTLVTSACRHSLASISAVKPSAFFFSTSAPTVTRSRTVDALPADTSNTPM